MREKVKAREEREKADKAKKAAERAKTLKKVEEKQTARQRELRKKIFRTLGQMNKGKAGVASGGGGARKFKKR